MIDEKTYDLWLERTDPDRRDDAGHWAIAVAILNLTWELGERFDEITQRLDETNTMLKTINTNMPESE